MGHDDRERKFEQALTRHLRAGTGAGNQANEKASEASKDRDPVACADAERLAAFHERMLSSEEMHAAKQHIAACSRCQEILAHLEATDHVLAEQEQEKVLEMRESVLSTGALYEDYAARQLPSPTIAAGPTSKVRAPSDIASAPGSKTRRWIAAAGAIAAGLLIWVAVRDNKPPTFSPAQNIQVTQERPENGRLADKHPAPMTQAPEPNMRTDGSDQLQQNENRKTRPAEGLGPRHLPAEATAQIPRDSAAEREAIGGITGGRIATGERERMDKYLHEAAPAKPAGPAKAKGNVVKQGDVTVTAAAPPAPANAQELQDKKAESLPAMAKNEASNALSDRAGTAGKRTSARSERDVSSKEKLNAGTAVAATAPRVQPSSSTSEMDKTTAKQSSDAALKKEADSKTNAPDPATQQVEVTANYERPTSLLKDQASDSKMILAPGGTVLWRLRATGRIERSADSGITWSRQNSGTTLELLAGSAPSEAMCWIVGRAGTILRTTDGGGHWSKVVSPITGDVDEIRAVDAMHAVIFDLDSKARFATNDGGVTWFLTTK